MQTIQFAFLSTPDTMMILAVCLVIFGPRKLPEIARTVGRAIREFRSASDDIMRDLTREVRPTPRPSQTNHLAQPLPETTSVVRPASAMQTVELVSDSSSVPEAAVNKST